MSLPESLPAAVRRGRFVFKVATHARELEQLHRLNHATFVREVPQHADPGHERLVDKFHGKNLYFVAKLDEHVVGMVSVHGEPPFSIASRLPDPRVLDTLGAHPLEVRLLAVRPEHRGSAVLGGLALAVLRHAQHRGYTHLLISGHRDRLRLYTRMGFEPLGPAVFDGDAAFVPMVAHVAKIPELVDATARRLTQRERPAGPLSLTPGAAQLAPRVLEALAAPPLDHRSEAFAARFAQLRRRLAAFTGARNVAVFCGSGTLANEVVAATLAADPQAGAGLVLSNGEFGDRLVRQAERAGLRAQVLTWPWGQPWALDDVAAALRRHRARWIWAVHLETSTGQLNDLAGLCALAAEHGARVCVDAISSVGAVPLALAAHPTLALASGVPHKALGGTPGLAFVFAGRTLRPRAGTARLPTYLDLHATLDAPGPRFTMPSAPLLAALAALDDLDAHDRSTGQTGHDATDATDAAAATVTQAEHFARQAALGRHVRAGLTGIGLRPLVSAARASPTVTTFVTPSSVDPEALLDAADSWGFTLGGRSAYLRKRGWLQLSTMGAVQPRHLDELFARTGRWLAQR
ncbi:MAG: aminotransferase V [Planctomycetota bacterium]|nr:MAG: aminotransferase V [Planctomycetota bacterium]